jgi:hypothetical protein
MSVAPSPDLGAVAPSPAPVAPSPDLGAVAPSPAPVAPSPAPVAPALARTDAGLDDGESSPAQPSAGSGAAPTDGRSPDIAEVRAAWPRIVAAIGNNPANRPLVTTCRPVESRDGFLVLGFPEDQAFMRDIAERKRSILEDGISSVVGHSVAVRCVVTNLELVEPVDSGEGDLVSQAKRIFDGDLAGVDDIE